MSKYIKHAHKSERESLDMNTWKVSNGVKNGTGVYSSQPHRVSNNLCDKDRDIDSHYVMHSERTVHPNRPSRFSYMRCKYNYCTGQLPGKYDDHCPGIDPLPANMAPSRFYQGSYIDPYNVQSMAMDRAK